MNGKTARLINKVASRSRLNDSDSRTVRVKLGTGTKRFWGRMIAFVEKLRERNKTIPPVMPPTFALRTESPRTAARKLAKRMWQRSNVDGRTAMRRSLQRLAAA